MRQANPPWWSKWTETGSDQRILLPAWGGAELGEVNRPCSKTSSDVTRRSVTSKR